MQEIMPRELGTVVVRSNPAGRKSRGQLSPSHEFALFFGHDRASPGSLRKTERELARYRFEDEVGRYDWNKPDKARFRRPARRPSQDVLPHLRV